MITGISELESVGHSELETYVILNRKIVEKLGMGIELKCNVFLSINF